MNPVKSAFRGVARVADTTTAAAGAVGGAAINGVVGGIQGAANGARSQGAAVTYRRTVTRRARHRRVTLQSCNVCRWQARSCARR